MHISKNGKASYYKPKPKKVAYCPHCNAKAYCHSWYFSIKKKVKILRMECQNPNCTNRTFVPSEIVEKLET